MLREKQRDDDPMVQYKGAAPAPNRFGIKPGYRWDRVNRSNGFEKTYFDYSSNKKADEYDQYKWSVEDM